ncbi:MAG: hypothetical protein IKF78_00015 [Atopobiaceae bacterium]|nr:hypothetical protein [Atopobiaceae bacterium]
MADIDAPLSWRMQQDGYLMQINQLRDENADLRKLCAEMWEAIKEHKRVTFAKLLRFGEQLVKLGVIE